MDCDVAPARGKCPWSLSEAASTDLEKTQVVDRHTHCACGPPDFLIVSPPPSGGLIDPVAIEPGKDYHIGPTLPAEMLNPPFRPPVAGRIAFFFGPISGAFVSVISLRRMGHPLKARRVLRWTLLAAVIYVVVLILLPDGFSRLVGLAAEIGFYLIFPRIQDREYDEWQSAHPTVEPSNGWRAMGWALLGTLMFVIIGFTLGFLIAWIFPSAL